MLSSATWTPVPARTWRSCFTIKPDPKAIVADVWRLYAGYQPPLSAEQDIALANGGGLHARLAHYRLRLASLAMFAGRR